MRGKENLVIVRAAQKGLMMHTMYFANEVRSFDEIPKGESAKITGAETSLAIRLIDELSNDEFEPEKYHDEYSERVLKLVNEKAEGKEITLAQPVAQRGQVIGADCGEGAAVAAHGSAGAANKKSLDHENILHQESGAGSRVIYRPFVL